MRYFKTFSGALCALLSMIAFQAQALEITRYVSPLGTGDGLTKETPTSDLGAMLDLSFKVDRLTLRVQPGNYTINVPQNGEEKIFPNVTLDGSWNAKEGEKVRINSWVSFENSALNNLECTGNIGLYGGFALKCESAKSIVAMRNQTQLQYCRAKSFEAYNGSSNKNMFLQLVKCYAEGGSYGLFAKDVSIVECESCGFSNQSEGGIQLDNCNHSYFTDCSIYDNKGDGAVRLVAFDNNAETTFLRCKFADNNVTNNHQHNIFITCKAKFYDCLFANNKEKDIDYKGFIHLSGPDFSIVNCTFINNRGGVEVEQYDPYRYQNNIYNCAFWGNGKNEAVSTSGADLPLQYCAIDHGTGIPELDKEKGLIILTEANKGFKIHQSYNGPELELEPSSVLIDKGSQRGLKTRDIMGLPRSVFGSTDIGCTELCSWAGLWHPTSDKFNLEAGEYVLCKATVGNKDYYALISDALIKGDDVDIQYYDSDWIYLDTMPVRPVIHNNGKFVERHSKLLSGDYNVDVYTYNNILGWKVVGDDTYDLPKNRPTVKISEEGKVTFTKPAASKPATKTAYPSKPKVPAAKSTTTQRRPIPKKPGTITNKKK